MAFESALSELKNYADALKLNVIKSDIEESINDANNNNLSYEEFLARLLQKNMTYKDII